jgi:hypothetical protein
VHKCSTDLSQEMQFSTPELASAEERIVLISQTRLLEKEQDMLVKGHLVRDYKVKGVSVTAPALKAALSDLYRYARQLFPIYQFLRSFCFSYFFSHTSL